MKIVKPNAELMFAPNNDDLFALKHLESVGRTCYKSENNITDDSCINFVSGIIKRGHEAVIEHYSFIYELNGVSLDSLEFLIKTCLIMASIVIFVLHTISVRLFLEM